MAGVMLKPRCRGPARERYETGSRGRHSLEGRDAPIASAQHVTSNPVGITAPPNRDAGARADGPAGGG